MSVLVVNDFLSGRAVDDLSTFLDESKLWESFSCNKDTRRDAFNFTLKLGELPVFLTKFKSLKHNLYHFVAIRTYKSGSIDEHIDFALGEQLIRNQGMLISKPETLVYYETIDPGMIGGELVIDGGVFKPVQNTAVIMAPNTSHAVTAIKEAVKPRVVLVCERYRVLSKYLKDIKTPDYQKG